MPWKSFNQIGSPREAQGLGMGKKGQEVTHIELPVSSQPHQFQPDNMPALEKSQGCFSIC